jgi:hypothetical protein
MESVQAYKENMANLGLFAVVRHRPEQNRVTWETPSSEAIPLLQEPIGANAGMKRTSVVEHNLYFAGLRSWDKQAVKT